MGRRRRRPDGPTGVLLVDKPVGPTSREVLDDVARRLDLSPAGHCGTLDPLASGLLVVVAGRATRLQDQLTGHDKSYTATLMLGARSATDDAEGPITMTEPSPEPCDIGAVESVFSSMIGDIDQIPPALSAVRVDGERLWEKFRRGETADLPTRRVRIDSIEIVGLEWPELHLNIRCGAGTYIRSIARDLGEALGCGAHVTSLRRECAGRFVVDSARPAAEVEADDLLSLEEAFADAPRVDVAPEDLEKFLNGRVVSASAEEGEALAFCRDKLIARALVLADGVRMKRLVVDDAN